MLWGRTPVCPIPEQSRRLDPYAEPEREILQDAPVIPVDSGGGCRVTNDRVGGLVYDPMGRIDMWKVWVRHAWYAAAAMSIAAAAQDARARRAQQATVPVACNRDCGGGCPLVATVEDGRVTRIADNPAGGPYPQGLHPRLPGVAAAATAPDRLTRPLVRTGPRGSGQFREASWPEAVRLVADGLAAVREKHGDGAVLALGGSGSCRGACTTPGASRRAS